MCYNSVGSDMCHDGLTELTVSLTLQAVWSARVRGAAGASA